MDCYSRHKDCHSVKECLKLARSVKSDAVSNARHSRSRKGTGLFDSRHLFAEVAIELSCFIGTIANRAGELGGEPAKDKVMAIKDSSLAKVREVLAKN